MKIYKCFHVQVMMALVVIVATVRACLAAEAGAAHRGELPANRKLGTIFNNDTDNIIYAMDPQKPVEAIIEDYRRALNEILDAKPGVLAQEVGAPDPVTYRSGVATLLCKYTDDAQRGVIQKLIDAGTDPLTIKIEQCRKYGVVVVASYRMNAEDFYDRQLERSNFGRENKHLAIAGANCLDPAHPEVYKHRMAIFREVAEKYDIDGIEFNFCRWYHMISEPEKNYPILTKMVAETRQMLDEVARKKGRKRLLLGVRVSPSLDTPPSKEAFPGLAVIKQIETNESCRARGTDVKNWIENGYVDYICPSLFWPPEQLYNGIVLPSQWPPVIRQMTTEPMNVPYLKSPPRVIPIDVGRQLFVDDFLIEQTTLERTFHKARLHPANPILKPDKPWEMRVRRNNDPPTAMPFSDGAWYDPADRLFKMWYMAGYSQATCYAFSSDGIHWTKPELNVVPGTNIVQTDARDSVTIWLDLEEADADRRFKMMQWGSSGISIHFSADGIGWGESAGWVGCTGDRSTFFYNPFRKVWVLSLRSGKYFDETESCDPQVKHYGQSGHLHSVARFRRYREDAGLLTAATSWPREDQPDTFKHWRFPSMWVWCDRLDAPRPNTGFGGSDAGSVPAGVATELYNLDAVAYESLMLGLFSVWRGVPAEYPGRDKINDICLGFILRQGELYSFWVSPDLSGASRGYVAGGGPGFAGSIDKEGVAVYRQAAGVKTVSDKFMAEK
jgi:hypothetical protein